MTRIFFLILFIFLWWIPIKAQNYRLIKSEHIADNSKDCRKIGDCVAEKYLINGTLYLTIFINNRCRNLNKFQDSFSFYNDTLNINFVDTSGIKYSIKFNKDKNKMDTFVFHIHTIPDCIGGYDCRRNQYELTGFNRLPKVIQFNHDSICNCPINPLSYEIYKGDTINLVNSNGKKHGLWLKFYDSGEILEKKIYNNGSFVNGTNYDKAGNDLHYIQDGYNTHIELKK